MANIFTIVNLCMPLDFVRRIDKESMGETICDITVCCGENTDVTIIVALSDSTKVIAGFKTHINVMIDMITTPGTTPINDYLNVKLFPTIQAIISDRIIKACVERGINEKTTHVLIM